MNSLGLQFPGAPDVIHVIRIAAVNQNVAGFKQLLEAGDSFVHHRSRHH
jgi:hypothetical protein